MNLAWESFDRQAEIRAYENLSSEYHSLGDLQKAKHFHYRVVGGLSVKKDSGEWHACMAALALERRQGESKRLYKYTQFVRKTLKAENRTKRIQFGLNETLPGEN